MNRSSEVVSGNPCSVGGSGWLKVEGSKMTLLPEMTRNINLDLTEIICPIIFCKKE